MKNYRNIILLFGDIAMLIVAFFVMLSLGFLDHDITRELITSHAIPFAIMYGFWIIVLYIFNFYDLGSARPLIRDAYRLTGAFLVTILVGVVLFYATPFFDITPRLNLAINVISFFILFVVWRRLFTSLFGTFFRRSIVIFGINPLSRRLVEEVNNNPHIGYEVVHISGDFHDIAHILATHQPQTIIIASRAMMQAREIEELYTSGIDVIDLATAYETILAKIPVDFIDTTWIIHHVRGQKTKLYLFFKSIMERVVALLILVLSSPLALLIAFGIKLEDGKQIFLAQTRVGKNGNVFNFYKFRSMQVLHADGSAETKGAEWITRDDHRITKVGRFTRRTHLDELAQMWNVVKGDMALVGPRPERPNYVEKLGTDIPYYRLRHIIKPGFTGWAQIKYTDARSVLESKEKFEYDLYYIKNASLWLDIGILLKTFQIFFK